MCTQSPGCVMRCSSPGRPSCIPTCWTTTCIRRLASSASATSTWRLSGDGERRVFKLVLRPCAFGPVTVAKTYRLLHAIFETAAEEDRVIARNPRQIKGAGTEQSDEREIVPLPVVFKLAETVPVRYRALILLATFVDMRWGELAGLRRGKLIWTRARSGSVRRWSSRTREGCASTRPSRRPANASWRSPWRLFRRSAGTWSGSLNLAIKASYLSAREAAGCCAPTSTRGYGARRVMPSDCLTCYPRPSPYRCHPDGSCRRNTQGTHDPSRALKPASRLDIPARQPRPRQRSRENPRCLRAAGARNQPQAADDDARGGHAEGTGCSDRAWRAAEIASKTGVKNERATGIEPA